jgi:competence/damage-inducible protein CinA-like protein
LTRTRIEVLAVGDELLTGATSDTNSTFIARELFALGHSLARVTVVGDAPGPLGEAFAEALSRSRILVVTGGLGPTVDDRTKEVIAAYFGDPLVLDPDVLADIERRFSVRGIAMPDTNRKQAYVPRSARRIPNPVGSAPGVHWEREGNDVFLLPGIPAEMQAMMRATVLPAVGRILPAPGLQVATFRTCGVAESVLAQRLESVMARFEDVTWAFYPGAGGVDVRVRRAGGTDIRWIELCDGIRFGIGQHLYSEVPEEPLAEVVRRLLVERGLMLAVAESCTGGLVGARITEVPGSSAVFTGGFVTYANQAKTDWIGVPEDVLKNHGAVSAPVAAAMARGARERAGADIAVSVTGIAGPTGGTAEKPVGLVYIGLAAAGGCWTRRLQLTPNRDLNRTISSQLAIDLVRRFLLGLAVGDPS